MDTSKSEQTYFLIHERFTNIRRGIAQKSHLNEKKEQKWEQNKIFLQNLYRFPSI